MVNYPDGVSRNFVIVREYSGVTAKKSLWKVESRPMQTKQQAEQMLDWLQSMENRKPKRRRKELFIVEIY